MFTVNLTITSPITVQIADHDKIGEILALLNHIKHTQETFMAALDDKIAALQAEVANNTTVEKSALALIQGFAAQLAAAVAAAQAAGATAAQLQSITDLQTTLTANDAELANAVQAGTGVPPNPVA